MSPMKPDDLEGQSPLAQGPEDALDHSPAQPTLPAMQVAQSTGLPMQEPGEASLLQQRADLRRTISELTGQFRYMGEAHPAHERTARRLAELTRMLAQLDRMVDDAQR